MAVLEALLTEKPVAGDIVLAYRDNNFPNLIIYNKAINLGKFTSYAVVIGCFRKYKKL